MAPCARPHAGWFLALLVAGCDLVGPAGPAPGGRGGDDGFDRSHYRHSQGRDDRNRGQR